MEQDQEMKLYQVSGLIPLVIDSAKQYKARNEYIIAKDKQTAMIKFEEVHPTALKADEGFTYCNYICHRNSMIPTVEPVQEI